MKKRYLILTVVGITILIFIFYSQSKYSKNEIAPIEGAINNSSISSKFGESNPLLEGNNSNNNGANHKEVTEAESNENGNITTSDFNFVEAWDSFEVKNYSASADILALSELYLTTEGEDLKEEDAKHLGTTVKNINTLMALLKREGEKNHPLMASYFSDIGLNLGKVYLAVALGMIDNDNDSQYFFSKTIVVLEKVIPTLKDDEKKNVDKIFRDLIKYKKELKEGTAINQQLKDINKQFQSILEKRKVYF
jgi:hypothetical protein